MSLNQENFQEFIFPHQPSNMGCVYYLLDAEGKILYIGKSLNFVTRIGTHWGNKIIPFTRCRYFFVPKEDIDAIETEHIITNSPPYNSSIPSNQKYFSFQRYKKIRKILKGRYLRVKKIIRELQIKDLNGFIHFEDWGRICEVLEKEVKS